MLTAVADAVEEVQLAPNQQLFAKGDLGTSMYVIVKGLVRVHIGAKTIVELSEGELVGELAALDPEPRSASVSAIDPTTLYQTEQTTMQGLMADHPRSRRGSSRSWPTACGKTPLRTGSIAEWAADSTCCIAVFKPTSAVRCKPTWLHVHKATAY